MGNAERVLKKKVETSRPGLPAIEPECSKVEPLREGPGPFRPNAAGLILRRNGSQLEILLGERMDTPNAWQWPQGGMDKGESPETCLLRELREEIGTSQLNVLYQFPFLLRYRFPQSFTKRFKKWVGQEQYYFIVALKEEGLPDLTKATTPEFREIKWFPLEYAYQSTVWFKEPVYRAALDHATEITPTLEL